VTLLPNEPPGKTIDELLESWPAEETAKPSKRAAEQDIKEGSAKGIWMVTGEGKKGDPRRYWITADAAKNSFAHHSFSNGAGMNSPIQETTQINSGDANSREF
jgi:hypothetical protein